MGKRKAKTQECSNEGIDAKMPRRRSCATMESYFSVCESHPDFRFQQAALESYTRTWLQTGPVVSRLGVIQIPVVVHVVHRTASENISDEQIASQIDVLNRDFSATNSDLALVPEPFRPLIGNPQIQFRLADIDPSGRPTPGITRTKTDVTSFSTQFNPVKSSATGGIDPWDTTRYLNLWTCNLAGGVLGYAQFPGGPPETDGVVVRFDAMGTTGSALEPFHGGRTATHEVGHYLNLSHIWGEERIPGCRDTDHVDDTPNQFGPNYSKPQFPSISCSNGPLGDLFMNYMDYVDDAAMFMFTLGQAARMRAALEGARARLGT